MNAEFRVRTEVCECKCRVRSMVYECKCRVRSKVYEWRECRGPFNVYERRVQIKVQGVLVESAEEVSRRMSAECRVRSEVYE